MANTLSPGSLNCGIDHLIALTLVTTMNQEAGKHLESAKDLNVESA
jgi:hypothetical protein